MKNFNRSNDRSGGDRGSKRRDFGNNRGFRPQMFTAICSDCGKECVVPFKPTGERPVYCTTCFTKHGKPGSDRPGADNRQRQNFDRKQMFEAICAACGKKCEVPFKPTGDKPVYCSQCFGKSGNTQNKAPRQSKPSVEQFDILNAKLDKILQALTPKAKTPKEKPAAKAKKTKVKKKK